MKIYLSCPTCFLEHGRDERLIYSAEPLDEGVAVFKCLRGHANPILLQAFKFEILAEVALTAIADGYYREAVVSFSSALERFYEFYVRVVLKSKGNSNEEIEDFWRPISRLSERQLGAFYMLHMTEVNAPPELLRDEDVSFRNKVVHQGLVPTRKEAIDHGQSVIDVVNNTLERLKTAHSDVIKKLSTDDLIRKNSKVAQGTMRTTYNLPRILNAREAVGAEQKPLNDWVQTVEKFNKNQIRRMPP